MSAPSKITIVLGILFVLSSCKKKSIQIFLHNSGNYDSVKISIYADSTSVFTQMVRPNATEYPVKVAEIQPESDYVNISAVVPQLNLYETENIRTKGTKRIIITLQTTIDSPAIQINKDSVTIRKKDQIHIVSRSE